MIAIVSDTHENIPLIRKAIDVIKSKNVDLVIHCGDMVSPSTLKEFEGFPFKFVLGNNDGEIKGLTIFADKLDFELPAFWLDFEYNQKRFLVIHDVEDRYIQERIEAQDYDYVLCGHTHVRSFRKVDNTFIFNPGSFTRPRDSYYLSYLLIEIEKGEIKYKFMTL